MDIAAPISIKYPRNVNVNFRKLDKVALTKLLAHYGVSVREDQSQNDLAIMTAKVFEVTASSIKETEVIHKIADKFCYASTDNAAKKRKLTTREQLNSEPASVGEQVAVKVRAKSSKQSDDWILGSILAYDRKSQNYAVQDEDDVGGGRVVLSVPFDDVRRLEDSAEGLTRGQQVYAVFPETTSFYKATVAKNVKSSSSSSSSGSSSHNNNYSDVVVKFDDDEDDHGKILARRIPARFVISRKDLLGASAVESGDE